ncbi:hypothetical protein SAMN05660964_01530 [Thiothrix caldifontis]|uniref:Uncharacterized protein n=1 Tax=Thiothrix caldifontis TaxID=525918 RepID=A0A1H4AYU5_9GAMM|nr:hypothetical protein [Thiothrix caldifontis]SEA41071.1 hypothetical protein SAMN05660964_01530 [Thiothrix caldifontis]
MSILGLVVFAAIVLAACYTSRCLQRGARRENLPREIEKLL